MLKRSNYFFLAWQCERLFLDRDKMRAPTNLQVLMMDCFWHSSDTEWPKAWLLAVLLLASLLHGSSLAPGLSEKPQYSSSLILNLCKNFSSVRKASPEHMRKAMAPPVLGQENCSAAAVLVLNSWELFCSKRRGRGQCFTGLPDLPDVHRHNAGQAEESRIALLPKAQKEDYNIQDIQDTEEL